MAQRPEPTPKHCLDASEAHKRKIKKQRARRAIRAKRRRAVTAKFKGSFVVPPTYAPGAVKRAIRAANRITRRPYAYGGGHASFRSAGYDCSGAVSYALQRLLKRPLASGAWMSWGRGGKGRWITTYANGGHAYVVIAGRRFDTSGPGESGPRWRKSRRVSGAYVPRHPRGL